VPLYVELVSPDRAVWGGEADMVVARTTEGEIGVLPNHVPVLGEMLPGPVRIVRSGQPEVVVAVHGGFLSVTPDRVAILAETVEMAQDIDVGRARAALERARAAGTEDEAAVAAARRAEARLRAAGETV
jgi:F-type H+-transporting ATPase subunit epsilon